MRIKFNKMSAKYIIALFLVQLVLYTHCEPDTKFFRKKYKYIEKMKSFYKLHTTHKNWAAAKETCEFEGASLFYANDEEEAMTVIDYWNSTRSYSSIFIGISSPNVKEVFETIDGLPISQVYEKWDQNEPNNAEGNQGCAVLRISGYMDDDFCNKKFPFICKKTLNSLAWNNACDLPDQSYVYSPQGRCYKFHLQPRSWEDAFKICNAEESYLAVINSDAEADFLVNITKYAPKEQVEDTDFLTGTVHIGFKFDQRWRTIKGESLPKSGYAKWGTEQPDGKGEDKCGSMFYDGQLNDIACSQKSFFICEHEPAIFKTDYDFRFGQNNQVTDVVCS